MYFFGRYLGTRLAWVLQRSVARHTYEADFQVTIDQNEAGYPSYACTAASAVGEASFLLQAVDPPESKPPFRTSRALTQFITYRLHGYFTASTGLQAHMPVGHPRMSPLTGSLFKGKFGLWSKLEILTPAEMAEPYSVLVVGEVPFNLYAPRPVSD